MSYEQTGNDVNGQPPVLQYMDRTPMMKVSASKRGCSELSPLEERSMEEVIQSALAAQMPVLLQALKQKFGIRYQQPSTMQLPSLKMSSLKN